MTTADQVLRDAADYIGEHGWTDDGIMEETDGSVCAMGAINRVVMGPLRSSGELDRLVGAERKDAARWLPEAEQKRIELIHQARDLLARHVGDVDGDIETPFRVIYFWNDNAAGTAEDVILALKKAAEDA